MRHVGRIFAAILAGYLINAALVAATEWILPRLLAGKYFFIVDLTTQCLYEIAAGYLCSRIADRSQQHIAILGLIALGLIFGSVSLALSWKTEPRWYGIALLLVWSPFVWIGHAFASRATAR